jgi:magnesium transporter
MINVYVWGAARNAGTWGGAEALPEAPGGEDVVWVDLEAPTLEEEEKVFRHFLPVHPLTLEDITRLRRKPDEPPHFPKVEEFPDYLFVVVNPLRPAVRERLEGKGRGPAGLDESLSTQLSAVLTRQVLITHHYEPVVSCAELGGYLRRHDAQASRGPDYLFHLILDVMVDQYAPLLDHFDDSLDRIELEVFRRPRQAVLMGLLRLKRTIIGLRKTLTYEREVLARLSRGEFALIDERETVYYRNVYDHLIRFTELTESSREMVTDLSQTHLAAQSNRLNEVMKVLTMISTTVLPMTLIAGVYGMNFEKNVWPDFKSSWGFPFALGLMALSGLGSFLFFRWKKWL